jgi:hypothetical protein
MTEEEHAILAAVARKPHMIGKMVGMKDLTDMHSDWMRYCWNSKDHRFLQASRGHYKTSAITIVGPVWWLIFNPEESIALCRKTDTEASDTLGAIKRIYENPDVRALYTMAHGKEPRLVTDKCDTILFDFRTAVDKEGSIDSYGVKSSLTGSHYGKMILDDIVTRRDRISRAEREVTKEFLLEVVTNIINPGKQVIHTGTPWHKEDAWSCFDGSIKDRKVFPIAKYDVYKAGLRTAEWIEEQRKLTTPSLWAANYELTHQSDDKALFKDPQFAPWEHSQMKAVAHLDAAFGGDCYNGFTIMRKISALDSRIQSFGKCWGGHIKQYYMDVVRLCHERRADVLYIENNADKGFVAEAIRETARSMGIHLMVKEYKESTNKDVKISTTLTYFWQKLVWDSETDEEYISQIVDYIPGASDLVDCPDSASSLLVHAFGGPQGSDPLFMYR